MRSFFILLAILSFCNCSSEDEITVDNQDITTGNPTESPTESPTENPVENPVENPTDIETDSSCYPTTFTGEATYYEGIAGTSSGNCSLPVTENDYAHCAMNTIDYNNSEACGACIQVNGALGSVLLKVVDRCPECKTGDIDMTEEAFATIANTIDGRVPISWKFTTCPTTENIAIVFKEGSSQFWTGIQLRNTKHAIANLEYQLPNGNWQSINREIYNYFIAAEGISSPMTLRATSVLNDVIILENINLVNDTVIPTNKQFSTPEECDLNN